MDRAEAEDVRGPQCRIAIDKRVGVEETGTGALVARQAPVHTRRVRITAAAAVLHDSRAAGYGQRETILHRQNAAKLPSSQHEICDTSAVHPSMGFTDRELPYPGGCRALPEVEGG